MRHRNFYGYPLDDLISMNIDEINILTPEEVAAERQKARREERNFFIFQHHLADGDIRTVHVYSYPVDINGVIYLFSSIIDQTVLAAAQNRNQRQIIGVIGLISLGIITATMFLIIVWRKNVSLKEAQSGEAHLKNMLEYICELREDIHS